MNTKKYLFVINLIFGIMLSQLFVSALPSVADEKVQPVLEETVENKKITSEYNDVSAQIDNQNDNNKTETAVPKEEIKTVYAPANFYDWLPKNNEGDDTVYERETVPGKETKFHIILSKIYKKIDKMLPNKKLNENVVVHLIINKINGLDQFIRQNNKITTLNFAPYYYIMPSIPDDYAKRIVFPADITNVMELLPYSLTIEKNTICKMPAPKNVVTSRGVTDMLVLMNAPSPQINIIGKKHSAKLVIDIRNNTLYKYDTNGFPMKAYLVATGASGTRTMSGLRIVTYKERFPYAGDPTSKRAQDPYSYGPYIIFMNAVNPRTGRQYVVEQLLHGNGSEYSIGKKVSHGCVRTNNSVMKYELSKEVKRGDYILLINPDIG